MLPLWLVSSPAIIKNLVVGEDINQDKIPPPFHVPIVSSYLPILLIFDLLTGIAYPIELLRTMLPPWLVSSPAIIKSLAVGEDTNQGGGIFRLFIFLVYVHFVFLPIHGDTIDEIWMAHLWALTSVELGNPAGKWLAAAALDRWHMYQGQPQKYGTQMVPDGIRYRLWDIDPATTDEERAQWNVPSLAEMEQRARQLTSANQGKMPPLDKAPAWLKQAIEKWNKA